MSSHKCHAVMRVDHYLERGSVMGGVVIGSAIVRSLPGLQSLNVTFRSREDNSGVWEESEDDNSLYNSVSPGAVCRQLAALKSLTDLTLDQIIRLNDSDLDGLAMLTGLRRLDLCWARPPYDDDSDDGDDDSLGSRALAKLGPSLTGLVELSLRGLRDGPCCIPGLMRTAGSLPALETLSVAAADDILVTYTIAVEDLAALIGGGAPSHLKRLSVTGMRFFDDDDYEPAMLQALTNLESLEFNNNSIYRRDEEQIPPELMFPSGLKRLAISGIQMKSLRHVPKSLSSLKLDYLPRDPEDAAHLKGITALDIGLKKHGRPDCCALFPNLKRLHISEWDDGDIYHLKLPAAVDDFGIQWPPMTSVHLDELYGFLGRHSNQITSLHIYPPFSCGARPRQDRNPRVPHLLGCIRTLPGLSCLRACVLLPGGKTLKEVTRKLKEATRLSHPDRPTIELYGQT